MKHKLTALVMSTNLLISNTCFPCSFQPSFNCKLVSKANKSSQIKSKSQTEMYNKIIEQGKELQRQREIEEKRKEAERLAKLEEEKKKQCMVNLGNESYKYARKVNVVATYYTNSAFDCGKTDGITASGLKASRGMVAVPKDIPFNTSIILEDSKGNKHKVVAQDRGGAIRWLSDDTMKMDVFVPNATDEEISNMGVTRYTGYILTK